MSDVNIMKWIDLLPNVEKTTLQADRNKINELMLEQEQLMQKAAKLRSDAYFQGCDLEAAAKKVWSIDVVEQAKRRTS